LGKLIAKKYHILALALLFTSCASTSPISLSDTQGLLQGEVLVFGRVKVLVLRGGVAELYVDDWDSIGAEFRIYILPDADSKPVAYDLSGDGTFYWHLPPGGYTITGYRMFGGAGRIFAQFVISEGTSLVYIGTLTALYSFRIEDDYEQAIRGLKDKFPEIRGEAAKSLMHLENAR
jgi:hypothetical protein